MRRPRGIVLVLLVVLIGGTVAMLRFGMGMYVSGFVTVCVTGRLVDGATEAPISNAWILVLPSRSWARDQRRLVEANRDAHERDKASRAPWITGNPDRLLGVQETIAGTRADGQGAFSVEVTHRWSEYRSGLLDPGDPLPPRYRTGALLVEIHDREPIILDAPHGTWTEHPDHDPHWATYDMGVIRVPPEK